jgi:hypothetical protein
MGHEGKGMVGNLESMRPAEMWAHENIGLKIRV